MQDYDAAIEIDPGFSASYYNRGNSRKDLGDKNGFCTDWSKARDLGFASADDLIQKFCN